MPNFGKKIPRPRRRRSSDQQQGSSGCSRSDNKHHQSANDGHDLSDSETEADIGKPRSDSKRLNLVRRSRRCANSSASRTPTRPQEEVESLAIIARADSGQGNLRDMGSSNTPNRERARIEEHHRRNSSTTTKELDTDLAEKKVRVAKDQVQRRTPRTMQTAQAAARTAAAMWKQWKAESKLTHEPAEKALDTVKAAAVEVMPSARPWPSPTAAGASRTGAATKPDPFSAEEVAAATDAATLAAKLPAAASASGSDRICHLAAPAVSLPRAPKVSRAGESIEAGAKRSRATQAEAAQAAAAAASEVAPAATWERNRVESVRKEAARAINDKKTQRQREEDSSKSSDMLAEEDDDEEEEQQEDDNDGSTMRRPSSDDFNNYNAKTPMAERATAVPREKEGRQQAFVTCRGTPQLPAASPFSEGGAETFGEMNGETSRQIEYARATSKMASLRTPQDEERGVVNSEGTADSEQGEGDVGKDWDRGDEYDGCAKESDDGEAKFAKDIDDSVDGECGRSDNGSGFSIDAREDAAERRTTHVIPVLNSKCAPSYDGAVERTTLLKQDPFVSGAAERKDSPPPPPPKVSFALDGTSAADVTQSRAGEAGDADTRAGDGARPAGTSRHMNSSSKTDGNDGDEFSRSDRESSSGGSGIASAMLEAATELAQNCSIPFVSEAATLMSQIVKLVSDSQDNNRGIEKRLARCSSIIALLESAAVVVGKDDNLNGAECHVFSDVQEAIADLVDLIKTYRSTKRVFKVLTSSVFKRREAEANVAIDRAILRSNFSMLAHHVGAEGSGPASSRHQAESAASAAANRRSRRQRKLNEIEIPEDDVLISSDELLGRGGFGAVHIGDFLGRSVACKVLQIKHGVVEEYEVDADERSRLAESEKQLKKTFLREVDAMIRLRSPHIVHVYGQITSSQYGMVLVMELLVGGDLQMLLKSSDQPLPEEQSRRIIRDVCAGMTFLHSKETVHGDLKPANVLLDGDGRAKIGDFGTAKWTHHTNSTGLATYSTEIGQNNHKFSLAWSAPEVLDSKGSTYASDVYSFGVIMWQVITTKRPWADNTPSEIMCAVLGGRRPEFAADTPKVIADVAKRCWDGKADERPTFRAIMENLKTI